MFALKQKFFPLLLLAGSATLVQSAELTTLEQKFSYVLGYQYAQQLKTQVKSVDIQALAAAVDDVMNGKPLQLSVEDMQAALDKTRAAMTADKEASAQAALEAGKAFLKQNKSKEGVQTLDSGLQYKVLQAGSGDSPTAESKVTVHYQGTLIDGTEFDSSYKRGQPTSFTLSGVIPGFRESLTRMNKGAKWQVFVPSEMGYGASGAGAVIGPNETLIFEIELISFE